MFASTHNVIPSSVSTPPSEGRRLRCPFAPSADSGHYKLKGLRGYYTELGDRKEGRNSVLTASALRRNLRR